MCGIAGYISDTALAPEVLAVMRVSLAHRGPDADGFYTEGRAHLGHRRLSVIDIAGSPQPMTSPDGRVAVIFNGEIYNFRQLRDELAREGWNFRSAGDTETLLAGWARWGEDVVTHLRGMFAFALWDAGTQTLFAAGDHLGVKPLHYAWDGTTLVFGSEQKAVLAHPAVRAEIDLGALRLYLECQFIPAPHCVFRAVRKRMPGHTVVLRDGALALRAYWRPDYASKLAMSETE